MKCAFYTAIDKQPINVTLIVKQTVFTIQRCLYLFKGLFYFIRNFAQKLALLT